MPTPLLSQLPRALRCLPEVDDYSAEQGDYVEQEPTYREAYNAAVDGRIPAERGDNGRCPLPVLICG